MENDNQNNRNQPVFSKKVRAGKRRTYFIDVRTTRSNDYYLTLTESKKRFNDDGYERHKLFLYKEDFNKFVDALKETVDHVKTDLLPEYDFDEFTKKEDIQGDQSENANWQEGDYSQSAEEKGENNEKTEAQSSEFDSRFDGTENPESSNQQYSHQQEDPKEETESVQSQHQQTSSTDEEAMKWD